MLFKKKKFFNFARYQNHHRQKLRITKSLVVVVVVLLDIQVVCFLLKNKEFDINLFKK
jgi:hypothetical protein